VFPHVIASEQKTLIELRRKGAYIKDYHSLFTKISFCSRFNRKPVVVECVQCTHTMMWIIEKFYYLKSVIYLIDNL